MYFYVPETKGLNEAEKKRQFYPGAKWGRKLREGEEPFIDEDEQRLGGDYSKVRDQYGLGDTRDTFTASRSSEIRK